MGIYIPGLRVPGENDDELWIAVRSDGTVTYNADWGWTENKKKAIPVPPHGRLIDAEALFKKARYRMGITPGGIDEVEAFIRAADLLDAPTIIQADPADKEGEG